MFFAKARLWLILQHGKTHEKQWLSSPILMPLRYALSKKWRFEYEAEAYREQLKHYPDDRSLSFAYMLSTNYNLNVTLEQALDKIKGV